MRNAYHIAIDLGAESGRVMAGTVGENGIQINDVRRFKTGGVRIADHLHWNTYRFYEEITAGLRSCADDYGEAVESIGVDAWGVDYVLLDPNNKLVGLPYHYRDERTSGTDEIIEQTTGGRWLYEHTGIQRLVINTLNQLLASKRDDAPALKSSHGIMFVGDLFHYLLSGESATEYSAASISQLINTARRDWEDEIFTRFGLPFAIKNRIISAGDEVGSILPSVAEETGLRSTVRVVAPAVHDTASAAVAIPYRGDNWAYISTGTWIMGGFEIDEPIINGKTFSMNISNSGGVFGKSLFLKNTMGLWIIQQCREVWNRNGKTKLEYADIASLVDRSPDTQVFIDPDDPLLLNPKDMVEAVRLALTKNHQNAPVPNEVGRIGRIVYQSLAAKIRFVLDELSIATGKSYDRIHAIGGGVKNRVLMQMTADITGRPVICGPVEASTVGNIVMQAYGTGRFGTHQEIRDYLHATTTTIRFEPDAAYDATEMYKTFLDVAGLSLPS